MRENFADEVKEWFSLKNGNLLVFLEGNEDFDDYDKTKSVDPMPSLIGSYILSHSEGLRNDVIRHMGRFYQYSTYFRDTDSLFKHKKYWSDLVDNGFAGESLGLGKNVFGNSGIF